MGADDSMVGRLLAGKYRIDSVIGQGGMGDVFLATQQPLDVKVVIKTLRSDSKDPDGVQRFHREAKATSKLRHPNCVSIIDFGEDEDGLLFIAMEYLRGDTLRQVLKRDKILSPTRTIKIVTQMLDVLHVAHQNNIIHRDLKPANIMLEEVGTQTDFVKVLDFGIAKMTDPMRQEEGFQTKTGGILGTPAYMAPEQATGQTVDGRADLYAISCIMYRALSGRLPFRGKSAMALLRAQITKEAPPLLQVAPDVPEELAALVDRGLSKEARFRPGTALEFSQALEAISKSLSISSGKYETIDASSDAAATAAAGMTQMTSSAMMLCGVCGGATSVVSKFCGECGAPTGRQSGHTTGIADRFADLRRHLPSAIVDELSGSKAAKKEQREVVVLLSDFAGHLSGDSETDSSASNSLNTIMTQFEAIAVRSDGHFDRRPDGTVAIMFGLTVSRGDDIERALNAAFELRALVEELGGGKEGISCASVVHSGEAMVSSGRAGLRYDPVGDTFVLPSRLVPALKTGIIVVTDKVRQQVPETVRFGRNRAVQIRSQKYPVVVFEVASVGSSNKKKDTKLPEAPFVGRGPELSSLLALNNIQGQGHLVHVESEPGGGKTRFLAELVKKYREKGVPSVTISCGSKAKTAYPVVDALFEGLGDEAAGLVSLGAPKQSLDILEKYKGKPRYSRNKIPQEELHTVIASAVRQAVFGIAQESGMLLVIDNADSCDPIVREILSAHARVPLDKVVMVTSARTGRVMPWSGESEVDVRMLTLPLLGREILVEMLKGLFRPSTSPAKFAPRIAERSAGSPLVALELVRNLIDEGHIEKTAGFWRFAPEVETVELPDGLSSVLQARLDSLPSQARDILACAAALGDTFQVGIINVLLATGASSPERLVGLLLNRGFFVETDEPATLRFAESSARKIIYQRMPVAGRTRLHAALGTILASKNEEFSTAPGDVGDHLKLGGDLKTAMLWYARALEEAEEQGDDLVLLRVLDSSIAAGQLQLAGGRKSRSGATRLAEELTRFCELSVDMGRREGIQAKIDEGMELAKAVASVLLVARLWRTKGRLQMSDGDIDGGLESFEEALRCASGLRDLDMEAQVLTDVGEAREKSGDHEGARTVCLRALELVQRSSASAVSKLSLRVLTAMGRISLRTGEVDQSERFFEQALTLAETLGESRSAAKILGNLGGVYHARENYEVASKFVERAFTLASETGDQIGAARHSSNLGTLYLLAGDPDAAKQQFTLAFDLAQRVGWREGMAVATAGSASVARGGNAEGPN